MYKFISFICISIVASIYSLNASASECLELGYNASHQTSQKIINAFKTDDNVALAELMFGHIVNGPSRKYVTNTKFDSLFSEEIKQQILETEGTKDQCYPMGSNGAMIARGSIWIADADEDTQGLAPIQSINSALLPSVNAPTANNSYWSSDLGDLHPACFSTLWWSSDNYELIAEHFDIYDLVRFESFPGEFFGRNINNFDPVSSSWAQDNPQSIGFKTSECVQKTAKLSIKKDGRVVTDDCTNVTDCMYKSYKLHRVINHNLCTELSRNFPGTCKSSYLVSIKDGEGRYDTRWAIYGLFNSQTESEVIFPLANFNNEYAALEFIHNSENQTNQNSPQDLHDISLCFEALNSTAKWTLEEKKQAYVQEAKRRKLNCESEEIISLLKMPHPFFNETPCSQDEFSERCLRFKIHIAHAIIGYRLKSHIKGLKKLSICKKSKDICEYAIELPNGLKALQVMLNDDNEAFLKTTKVTDELELVKIDLPTYDCSSSAAILNGYALWEIRNTRTQEKLHERLIFSDSTRRCGGDSSDNFGSNWWTNK